MAGPTTTALHVRHLAAGARMADFAGWELPLSFAGTVAEHSAVRERVGAFDVSHLGTVWVEGPGAAAVVDATFTNDPGRLADGRGQYTLLCDERGGIVDDLIVSRLAADRWLAVPNAANAPAVTAALAASRDRLGASATVRVDGPERALVAVQGPDALQLVDAALVALGLAPVCAGLAYLGLSVLEEGGPTPMVVSRTGYTGERGVELVVPAARAVATWDALLAAGAAPCGLGARDTLRLEMGYPLHGNELSTDVRPDEAGLSWAVRTIDRAFPGRDALHDAPPPSRRALGLVTRERRPARHGMRVSAGGTDVGVVTSGTFSPTLGHGIALALVDVSVADGDRVEVDVRGSAVAHDVVRPPFVDRDPRR